MSGYPERLPATHCWQNARLMAQRHPELRYVEGWLVIPWPDGSEMFRLEHAWNETPDGSIIDATGWAYDDLPVRYQRRVGRPSVR
jgi:hypothetical protein